MTFQAMTSVPEVLAQPPAQVRMAAPLRYWRGAVPVTLALFAVIAVRVAELSSLVGRFKPALTIGLFGSLLLWFQTDRRVRRMALRDPQMRAASAYFIACTVSIFFAYYRALAFLTVQGLVFALLAMVAFLLVRPVPHEYERLRRGIVYISAVYGLLVAMKGQVVEGTRLTTTGTLDANDIAAIMAPMVPLGLISVVQERGRRRYFSLIATAALLYTIAKTGSRGGFLALVVGVLVFVLALNARRTFMAFLVIVAGALGMWQFGPQTFRDRVASLGSVSDDYNVTTDGGRLAIWRRSLGYYADRPILGVGPNNMSEAEGRRLRRLGLRGRWWPTHNAYLQAFVEVGTIGGIAFLAMFAIALRRAAILWGQRGPARRPEVLAGLLAYCTAIMFLSHAFSYMLFALLGFSALAWHTFRQSRPPLHSRPMVPSGRVSHADSSPDPYPTSHPHRLSRTLGEPPLT